MQIKTINLQNLSKKLDTVMIPAQSSNIMAFGYNVKSDEIWVLFRNLALYSYKSNDDKVSMYNTFIEGINAESKGKWVNGYLVNNKQLSVEAYEIK